VGDVAVLEAAHHLDDGVGFPDVGQEGVAQAFPLAGAAMSTNSWEAGRIRWGVTISASRSSRSSGTSTTPVLGSMVQKG
jgi:hypothetical protein